MYGYYEPPLAMTLTNSGRAGKKIIPFSFLEESDLCIKIFLRVTAGTNIHLEVYSNFYPSIDNEKWSLYLAKT